LTFFGEAEKASAAQRREPEGCRSLVAAFATSLTFFGEAEKASVARRREQQAVVRSLRQLLRR
jgi:hypothetical protein